MFMDAICCTDSSQIDACTRSIHWMSSWRLDAHDITVSCTILQPHITNCNIGLSGMTYMQAKWYSDKYFSSDESRSPALIKTIRYCQALGKYAIPFVEQLLENGAIKSDRVSWNNTILSQTQPIFCVVSQEKAYECKLTHTSCKIMSESHPESVTVSHPVKGGQNFTFRCSALRGGGGTGPSMTVHTSGVIQYQGKPQFISLVASSFRDTIVAVMTSANSMRFLKSLALIRTFDLP